MLMYADDSFFTNSQNDLQKLVDNTSVYYDRWKIDADTSKTKVCILERKIGLKF